MHSPNRHLLDQISRWQRVDDEGFDDGISTVITRADDLLDGRTDDHPKAPTGTRNPAPRGTGLLTVPSVPAPDTDGGAK